MVDMKKVFMHGIYVAGMTFFGTLGSAFVDGVISSDKLLFSLVSAFISGGSAFFISFGIEQGYDVAITKAANVKTTSITGRITRMVEPVLKMRSYIYLL